MNYTIYHTQTSGRHIYRIGTGINRRTISRAIVATIALACASAGIPVQFSDRGRLITIR